MILASESESQHHEVNTVGEDKDQLAQTFHCFTSFTPNTLQWVLLTPSSVTHDAGDTYFNEFLPSPVGKHGKE